MIAAHVPLKVWTTGGGIRDDHARLTSIDRWGDPVYTFAAPCDFDGLELVEMLSGEARLEIEWPL